MKKINVAELLKDCPKGMELDCTIYEDVYFDFVDEINIIHCYIQREKHKTSITFYRHGTWNNDIQSKCVIFPKGKTTWEGFVPPCKFKEGDVLTTDLVHFIFKSQDNRDCYMHCYYAVVSNNFSTSDTANVDSMYVHPATKEQRYILFQKMKEAGYEWNAETKTLEKITRPNFKVGDWVTDGVSTCQIHSIDDTQYWYSENCILGSIESVDKRYHLWTINDAKDGDVIFYDDGWTCIFKNIHGIWYSSYCFITDDGEFHTGYERHAIDSTINGNAHPATEEQCNLLFQKMKEAGYKWNPETKVLEKISQPKFKDGDIIADEHGNIAIYKGTMWYNKKLAGYYCGYRKSDNRFLPKPKRDGHFGLIEKLHHATEEEKAKLFQAIKDNGYKWNEETKTLEKLIELKFKVGDRIKSIGCDKYYIIKDIEFDRYILHDNCFLRFNDEHYFELASNKLVEPKFKVGDKITNGKASIIIDYIDDEYYYEIGKNVSTRVFIKNQDEWKLVPNKFDINTLIPFESKVLVRHNKDNKWTGSFFSFIDRDLHLHCYKFVTTADKSYPMMIPFKGNEYLLGKTDDCQEFYKIWES